MLKLLLLLTILPAVRLNPLISLPTPNGTDLETTNAYLRSFLPWWPKNEQFTLDSALTRSSNDSEPLEGAEGSGAPVPAPESNYTELAPAEQRVHDIPSSPLDELSPAAPRNLASREGNFIINFDEMGECPRDCSKDLQEALNLVLQEMSHVERYQKICGKYTDAITCVHEDVRCDSDDRGMFATMTSGLDYMCVEQELAFNATIKCIDEEAGLVQSECENQCQTRNLFMNWIMRTAMKDTIQQGVNGIVGAATGTNANPLAFLQQPDGQPGWADMLGNLGKPPTAENPQEGFENFRQFTNDLCRIGDCMLDCIRSKFNTRCEGSAGTLLSEVLVRPIAASQNKLQMLRPVLGMFMPEHCAYLHNNADLKKHRIDSTMDEELKRMYTEKAAKEVRERTEQDELLANLVPLDENGVPLPRALPDLEAVESPLDNSVKTLDQLILDMYSKNGTKVTPSEELKEVEVTFEEEEEGVTTTSGYVTTTSEPEKDSEEVTTSSGMVGASGEGSGDMEEESEASGDVETSSEISDASGDTSTSSENDETSGDGSGHSEDVGPEIDASGDFTTPSESGNGSGDVATSSESDDASGDGSGDVRMASESSESSGDTGEDSDTSGDVPTSSEVDNASGDGSGEQQKTSESSRESSGDVETSEYSGMLSDDVVY